MSFEETLQSIQSLSIDDSAELQRSYKAHSAEYENDNDSYDQDGDEDGDGDEDEDEDDENNEFLNSSSFLSNSQIIRSSNVNMMKNQNKTDESIRSPTRSDPENAANKKKHFQLFVPSVQQSINSDNSDTDHDQDGDDDLDKENDQFVFGEPNGKTKLSNFRPIKTQRSRSSKFIDIDSKEATPKLPRIHPDSTPWRKLRPPSMFLKENIAISNQKSEEINEQMSSNFMKSFFDEKPVNASSGSPLRSTSMFEPITTATSEESGSSSVAQDLNNLRKQITNYKVQLRILVEYIRTLLKMSNNSEGMNNEIMIRLEQENGFLLNEREFLQNELNSKKAKPEPITPYDVEKDPKYISKIEQLLELEEHLASTQSENRDLKNSNNILENDLNAREETIKIHVSNSSNYGKLLNELITHLLKYLQGNSAKAIDQARSGSIDTKIRVLMFAFNELLEKFDFLKAKLEKDQVLKSANSSPLVAQKSVSSEITNQIKAELEESKAVEGELRELLKESTDSFTKLKIGYESLNLKYNENLKVIAQLKKLLSEKQVEVTLLNDKIIEFETNSIERSDLNTSEKDAELLKNRINVIKSNHSKEVQLLTQEIELLKSKLSEERKSDRENSLNQEINQLKDEYYRNSKNYESSIENLEGLLKLNKHEFELLTSDFQNLQTTLNRSQDELAANERDYQRKLDHAAKELNQSVAKQRTFAAEKSKLAFALEDSRREKSKLALNNNSLLEKVNRLTYQISNLGEYEIGFKNLHQLSVSHSQNLLSYFKNVLDPESIKQAESKLRKLRDPNLVDIEAIHTIHRSLLSYFENAINSIMKEFSEMYLKGPDGGHSEEELNRLRDEISALTEELEWCYANGEFNDIDQDGDQTISERTKLRLAELEKRRKMEREQRKAEHMSFSARIKSLEDENRELKEKLKLLGK